MYSIILLLKALQLCRVLSTLHSWKRKIIILQYIPGISKERSDV